MINNGSSISEWKLRKQMCEVGRQFMRRGSPRRTTATSAFPLSEDRVLCSPDPHFEGIHEARRPVHRGHGRQADLGQSQAVERDPLAPDDHEGPARHSPWCIAIRRTRPPLPSPASRSPSASMPEIEVFPGEVTIHPTNPGGQAFADTVLPYVKDTDTILLANHGTLTYGSDLKTPTSRPRSSTPTADPDPGQATGPGTTTATRRRPS